MKTHTQHDVIPGRETEMVRAGTGAYLFAIDDWKQLERFIVLGTEGGTYHIKEETLTKQNAMALLRCLDADGLRVINMITEISRAGRAYKNNPALFALAIATAHPNVDVRRAAFSALPKVARTSTHLFTFAEYMQSFRGWGKAARKAVSAWYTEKSVKDLAYQMIKYQQRDGWTHRDLLRLSHPVATSNEQEALFRFAVGGAAALSDTARKVRKNGVDVIEHRPDLTADLHEQIVAFEEMKKLDKADVTRAISLIESHDLPREAVPTEFLSNPEIWNALLKRMPMTAAIRNLGVMTKNGVFNIPEAKAKVLEMLSNVEILQRSRVHPMQVLIALKTYDTGGGFRSSSTWTSDKDIVNALDKAFYKTFKNVVPTGKKILLALDVSGSMGSPSTTPIANLTAREVTAAMSLVTMNVEDGAEVVGFQDKLVALDINPDWDMAKVLKRISNLPFGSTDCSAPFEWARSKKKNFDAFIVYTDNDTGTGSYWGRRSRPVQPSEAMKKYRKDIGVPAKMVVVSTMAHDYTIADPKDAGMLDICGFDASIPGLINDFIKD